MKLAGFLATALLSVAQTATAHAAVRPTARVALEPASTKAKQAGRRVYVPAPIARAAALDKPH